MGFLGASTAKKAITPPASNFRIQQSVNGLPIPYVQGQTRFAGNLIWYDNFRSESHTSAPPSGGKGGASGGGKGATGDTTYTYSVDVVIALCEGPIAAVLQVWNNKTAEALSTLGFTVFDGSYAQTGWSYLTTQPLILQEEHAVPNDGVYKVTVNFTGAPFGDHGVTDGSGNAFTNNGAPSPPAGSYYSDGAGGYFFNAADALSQVIVSYTAGNQVPPDPAINYRGISYVAAEQLQLGDSQQLPNFTFEVKCSINDAIPGFPDGDTAAIVADYLTNPFCGAGFPSGYLGDFSSASAYSNYCRATSMLISPSITSQTAANSFLSDLAKATNSEFVWSGGKLKVVPYGDEAISANGATYTPPSAPIYDLGEDDFLPLDNAALSIGNATYSDSGRVRIVRSDPATLMNALTVEYLDRGFAYNPATVTAKDDAAIATYGLKTAQKVQAHFFCFAQAASMSAMLALGREWKRRQFLFSLGGWSVALEQMDTVTLTTGKLNRQRVRIKEIAENDNGTFTFIAEEYAQGTASAPVYSRAKVSGSIPNLSVDPGGINNPIIFEPPDGLAGGLEIWAGISGKDLTRWGGCEVWLSTDGSTYKLAGRQLGPSRMGVTTNALPLVTASPTGRTIDTTNLLKVDVSQSGATLLGGGLSDVTNLSTLSYVGGELLAYRDATLTSAGKYTLGYLARGAYSDGPLAVPAGSPFLRLDAGVFQIAYLSDLIGQPIYIKFRSFNIFGYGLQSLADVAPYNYTPQGSAFLSPLPNVTGFASNYVAGITTLAWNAVKDFRQVDYEVRTGTSWSSAQVVARTPLLQMATIGDGTYWIAAHFTVPNGPDVYSETPVSVVISNSQLVSNVIASHDEAATGWTGTFVDTVTVASFLTLIGAGDILSVPDVLAESDVLYYGGAVPQGTYTIPVGHQVDIGYVADCQVIVTVDRALGISPNAFDVRALTNVLTVPDVLGVDLGNHTGVTPQIRISQDGTTWGAWQNWLPGVYPGRKYDCRVIITTSDPTILPRVADLVFKVDVPDRLDHYAIAIPSGGLALTFRPDGAVVDAAFNGGPNGASFPHLGYTILNSSSGDTLIVTALTLAGCTLQILNAGSPVSRNINLEVQGY